MNPQLSRCAKILRHYTDLMIFVGAGLVPAQNGASTRHCPYEMPQIFCLGIYDCHNLGRKLLRSKVNDVSPKNKYHRP